MRAVKVLDSLDKRDRTVAGKGQEQGTAAGDESVDDRTMTKVADYRLGAGGGSKDNGN